MTQLKFNTPDLAGFPDMYGELAILYEDTLGGVHDGGLLAMDNLDCGDLEQFMIVNLT